MIVVLFVSVRIFVSVIVFIRTKINDYSFSLACAPAPDRGPCLGYMKMWYYDHKTSRCSTFEYSGCKGNDNKFLREQECKDTCVSRILNL